MWPSYHIQASSRLPFLLQRAGLCDRLAQDLQLHLPASLSTVQAAEKKLQELQASVKQSEDAEAQVSGLKRELEQVQATLQASKDAAKAADTEKVGGGRSTHGTSLHILFLASCNLMPMPPAYAFISSRPEEKRALTSCRISDSPCATVVLIRCG